ncbi:MAG: LuxR C-terminal-related transcriptional regulator [Candidatus Promineifilaceae bacterium]|nr:LuxR C-terminal-related transcriptional regulator [Candidatus Promineifilaceae bacterium]
MNQLFKSLSNTQDGAFIVDGRHRIIFWNRAAEEILGYSWAQAAGRQCFEILGGSDEQGITLCERFCRVALRAERGDILPNQDVFITTREGDERCLNVTTFAYSSSDETVGQVIVHLFRDVTENKKYQRFFNQVLAASAQLHQNGSIQKVTFSPLKQQRNDLTEREWQVLALMAQGLGTEEMAGSMNISPSTVRNHVQNILDKLGVHSRLEAIAYAYQHGLIEIN